MYNIPENTLYQYLNNPIYDEHDFSHLPAYRLQDEIKKLKVQGKQPVPETEVLKFYLANHFLFLAKNKYHPLEKLPPEVARSVEKAFLKTNEICKRVFFHTLLSCIYSLGWLPKEGKALGYIESTYGSEMKDYIQSQGQKNLYGMKNTNIGSYMGAMVSVFTFNKMWAAPPWAAIIATVRNCANGTTSFEKTTDLTFSLCHNGGSVLNKGHLYTPSTEYLFHILDVQHSGQIPQWIHQHQTHQYVDKELLGMYQSFYKLFPSEFEKPIIKKTIDDCAEKRKAAQKKKQAIMNAMMQNNPAKIAKVPDVYAQRMDDMLINDFKEKKLIR